MRFASLLAALLLIASTPAPTFEELNHRALEQYKAKDYAGLVVTLQSMDAMNPNHPRILTNLALAYAFTGRNDEAFATMDQLLRMNVGFDTSDEDFNVLRSDPRFKDIAQRLAALRSRRVAGASIAYRIPRRGLITEGLAHDEKTHAWFVSSVRKGTILRIDARGRVTDFASGPHGLSGIEIDPNRRLLWACSTASPRVEAFRKGDPNDASVVAFDLESGKLVHQIPMEPKAFCDDLTLARDGSVYVSDSTGSILWIRAGTTHIATVVPRGVVRSPQGSVLSASERILYVSDYGGPIRAVDLATGDVVALRMPPDFQPRGIDGLTRHGRDLIAVQNGIEPNRIVRLTLSPDGFGIAKATILEMNHPNMDEPTIGKVAGGYYYFIAASQGNKFDNGPADEKKLTDAYVMKIGL